MLQLALGWFGLAWQKLCTRGMYHEPTPLLLALCILVAIGARAPVFEDPPFSFLTPTQPAWAMDWREGEGHLIDVRVCLLPSSHKNVLHTMKLVILGSRRQH